MLALQQLSFSESLTMSGNRARKNIELDLFLYLKSKAKATPV